MWQRRHIGDSGDIEAGGLQSADCLFATSAWTLHEDFNGAEAMLHRLARGSLCTERCGVWRALARTLEAGDAA